MWHFCNLTVFTFEVEGKQFREKNEVFRLIQISNGCIARTLDIQHHNIKNISYRESKSFKVKCDNDEVYRLSYKLS